MPAMPDALQQLQLDIAATLAADELFDGVQVVVARPRSEEDAVLIQSSIDNALAGLVEVENAEADMKAGLCVVVMMSEGEVLHPNEPGPQMSLVQTVRVIENPLVNMGEAGTLITAEQAALNVLTSLHQLNFGHSVLLADKKSVKEVNLEGRVAYDVTFRRELGVTPRLSVQRPQISVADPQMTITCGTSGAAIYWTSDGSLPTPTNGALYAAPVDVGELGVVTIRARAYLTGRRASDCASFEL